MDAQSTSNIYASGNIAVDSKALEADDEVRQFVQQRLNEAAERVTFHRLEVERWERVGRACGAAAIQIDSASPVGTASPDDFLPRDQAKANPLVGGAS